MDGQRRVLIVGNREDWRRKIRDTLPERAADPQFAQTHLETANTLSTGIYDLAIIDLWLEKPLDENDSDDDGTHDGLEMLLEAGSYDPIMKTVVICEGAVFDTLRNTPGVPRGALFLPREKFDPAAVSATFARLLDGEVSDLLHPFGQPNFLRADLIPPAIGARPGKPRVLVVENQSFWQDTICRALEEGGYFWRLAPSGSEAMNRLMLESFNVLLFAMSDPAAHWKLLDFLVGRSPKTKLLVVGSNLSSVDVARLFMGYPVKGFIDKNSFSRDDLLRLVESQITQPVLRITTLGDFRIHSNGKLVNTYGHPLAELAIKVLLTRIGESISADELIEYLWPGADRRTKYAGLSEVISAARMALEPDLSRASDSRLIVREGSSYRLDVSADVEIDAEQVKRLIEEGREHELRGETDQALRHYEMIKELYRGDYLAADRAHAWTMKERIALQGLYTEALNRMADIYAGRGNLDMAIKAANQALQADAYVEGTYRRLMRYYACKGEKNAAITTYKALAKLFSEFIGEEVSLATTRLYEDIAAGRRVDCVEMTSGQWRITLRGLEPEDTGD